MLAQLIVMSGTHNQLQFDYSDHIKMKHLGLNVTQAHNLGREGRDNSSIQRRIYSNTFHPLFAYPAELKVHNRALARGGLTVKRLLKKAPWSVAQLLFNGLHTTRCSNQSHALVIRYGSEGL